MRRGLREILLMFFLVFKCISLHFTCSEIKSALLLNFHAASCAQYLSFGFFKIHETLNGSREKNINWPLFIIYS